jgi:hypothetical protein
MINVRHYTLLDTTPGTGELDDNDCAGLSKFLTEIEKTEKIISVTSSLLECWMNCDFKYVQFVIISKPKDL